jgi:hypothetical protein
MYRATGIIAMRLGPGKHLKEKTLMNGAVSPEEFNYFHEVYLPSFPDLIM